MATAERTISCETCTRPYKTRVKNAKLCKVCQVLRDMKFVEGWDPIECDVCGKEFKPVERPRKPVTCPKCTGRARSYDRNPRHKCGSCGEEKPAVHDLIHLCLDCVADPGKRTGIMKSLMKKQIRAEEGDYS